MKLKLLLLFVIGFSSCKNTKKNDIVAKEEIIKTEITTQKIELEIYDFAGFEPFLNKKDNKVHVINFWATWCAPCIKELPHFEKLNTEYANKNVEVLLVSLDFPHLYDSKLKPFITNRKLKSKVIALDDVHMNSWIPKVDKAWSGSLPATIIYKNNDRKFFEKSFTSEELENEVKQFLN
jgi:thiol-disulfide isomerase/thioredoxin